MRLRMLEKKDAPLMLEWMHDISVVGDLKADFIGQEEAVGIHNPLSWRVRF